MTASVDTSAAESTRAPRLALLWARACFVVAVALGVVTLVGWWIDAPVLLDLGRDGASMKANEALCLILGGSALGLLVFRLPLWLEWGSVSVLASAMAVIGGMTFAQYIFGVDLGVDEILVREAHGAALTSAPGRMAPSSALSYLFLGLALLLRLPDSAPSHRLAELLAAAAALFGFQALVGYAYGVDVLYALPDATAMAPHAAAGVLVLSSGVLLGSPSQGFVGRLLRSGFAATVVGGLVPAAVVVPFLLGLVALAGVESGMYSPLFGLSLVVVLVTVFFLGFVGWTARQLWEADQERLEAEARRKEDAEVVEILHRIGQVVTGELDRDTLVQNILDTATRLVGGERGVFLYREPGEEDGRIRKAVAGGEGSASGGQDAFPWDRDVILRTLTAGESLRFPDLERQTGRGVPGPIRSYLSVPVRTRGGEVIGGLFFSHPDRDAFMERHRRMASGVADWAAVAMDNARLFEGERQARGRAEAAVREREEVLAVVSHDLRNPLSTISAAAALLEELDLDPEEQERQLGVIRRSSQHMNRLIQDLLDLAKIEAGGLTLDLEEVRVAEVLDEAREMFCSQAERGDQDLVIEAPGEPIVVEADRERVLQIFSNLLGNAFRHAHEGTPVVLGAGREGGRVRFWVRNRGEAIPAEELPRIFDRFWRGGDRRRDRTGAGLGLSIVKAIVDAHGGEVHAESRPDGETTFRFDLPSRGAGRRDDARDGGPSRESADSPFEGGATVRREGEPTEGEPTEGESTGSEPTEGEPTVRGEGEPVLPSSRQSPEST